MEAQNHRRWCCLWIGRHRNRDVIPTLTDEDCEAIGQIAAVQAAAAGFENTRTAKAGRGCMAACVPVTTSPVCTLTVLCRSAVASLATRTTGEVRRVAVLLHVWTRISFMDRMPWGRTQGFELVRLRHNSQFSLRHSILENAGAKPCPHLQDFQCSAQETTQLSGDFLRTSYLDEGKS
jgi:hypothetical protein